MPLIAAAYEPSMTLVRALVRAGAHDVVPLPLDPEELETALDPIRRMVAAHGARPRAGHQKIVTIIKSEGGVGATALLGQLATRFAASEAERGPRGLPDRPRRPVWRRRASAWPATRADVQPTCSRPGSGSMAI